LDKEMRGHGNVKEGRRDEERRVEEEEGGMR
jgi:hypothetical protein